MKENIIGIVGFGSIGKKHFNIIKKNFNYDKIIILINKSKQEEIGNKNKIIITNKVKDFISKKPNHVFICSPANTHLKYALLFASYKINIFIEKPLSNKLELKKIQQLKKIIDRNNLFCLIGYVFRFDDLLIKFSKVINKINVKTINHIYSDNLSFLPDWRKKNYIHTVSAKKKLGGGVILESSHEIDYLYSLFGNLKVLFSHISKSDDLQIDVEESAKIMFITKFNSTILLNLNFNSKFKSRKCVVYFKDKIIVCDFNKRIIYKINYKNKKSTIYKSKSSLSNAYLLQDKIFINKKINTKNNYCDINQGSEIMKIVKKIFLYNRNT